MFRKKTAGTHEIAQKLMNKSESEISAYAEYANARELKDVMKEVDKRFLRGKDCCVRTANVCCLKPFGADINYPETKDGMKEFIDDINDDSSMESSDDLNDKLAAKAAGPVKNVTNRFYSVAERRQQANLIIAIIEPIYDRKRVDEHENRASSKRGCFR